MRIRPLQSVFAILLAVFTIAPVFAAPPDYTAPLLDTAFVSGDGSEITLTYIEANSLDQSSTPAITDFTVTTTISGVVTVSKVTVNANNTITLALSSTILVSDTVALDYISGVNPVQDTKPNVADSFSGRSVSTSVLQYNSTFWTPISPAGGTQYDYFVDQQTGQGEGDIVGDGGANPGFQVHFNDNGSASNTDGTLSFRFRLAKGGSNYYMVGIDADLDGVIDVFVKMDTTNNDEISIYENGGGLNISPSTTDIGAELYAVPTTNITLNSSAVTDIDGNMVVADLDGDTNTDFYISGSVSFSELVTALASANILINLTDTDPLRYAVATSVNGNTFNQDIAGLPKDYDAAATYVSSGAFSDPVTLDGSIAPVQPGTPVINELDGDILAYVMNDAVSIIDQSTAATITDSDNVSLDDAGLLDGALHVEITAGAVVTEDVLGITEGVVNGATVTLSAGYAVNSVVSIDGVAIGTITDIGTGSGVLDPEISFTVTFDQLVNSATLTRVNTLIQSVTYVNSNVATTTEGFRTVSFLLSDGVFNTEVSTSVSVTQTADIAAPVITLLGSTPVSISVGSVYSDAGATASDIIDGDITANIISTSTVNTGVVGSYSVTYNVSDSSGNAATPVVRVVDVVDTVKPVITMLGSTPVNIELGSSYTDAGATASDNIDGDITGSIVTNNPVNVNAVGTYTVTYNVADAEGNDAIQLARTVIVEDTIAPGVSILNQPAGVNDLDPFNVTFQFTEVVSGFVDTDISVLNATVSNFVNAGGVGDTYTADITPTGAGNVTVGVNAAVAQDISGNTNTAAVTMITAFDNTPPVVAITSYPAVNLANQSAYTVSGTCSAGDGDVLILLSLDPAFFTPYESCMAGGTWSSTFDLSALSDTAAGFKISISAQQTDAAGNSGSATAVEVDKDTVRPGVQIQNVPAFVNADEFTVTVVFDEGVSGFDSGDISVTNGIVNVASFNAVDAQTYTFGIAANGIGDVAVNVAAGVAQDLVGNDNTAAAPAVAVYDTTAPVVSITVADVVNAANDDNYIISGACETADGDVTVSISGATPPTQDVSCTAGSWTAVFDVTAIADGSNAVIISAGQTDAAGNQTNVVDVRDKDVVISVPAVNPLVTNNATPVITGTADTGTSNEIVIAGATYTVVATAGNLWTLDTSVAIPDSGTLALVDGANEVVVTSTDYAGNSEVDLSSNEITLTLDDDNDGIPNAVECPSGPPYDNSCTDTDGDGTPDFQEVDSDNDGIPDANEAGLDGTDPVDSDGDGIPDYRDTDSDNDGIDDSLEGVIDTDGDGIPDYVDVGTTDDSDGDGIPDTVECPVYPDCVNTDSDGAPDYLDTDSDNDTLDDMVEAGVDPTSPVDTDGDGTPDYRDTDSDDEGADDSVEGTGDVDGDGIPDYVDADTAGPGAGDSDGDGIADDIECALYPLCADSDVDGIPDYMEIDSDDDGILDVDETGSALNDADSDGIDDTFDIDITGLANGLDRNGDGIDDAQPLDTDGDGIPDYQDTDSDGDGIEDIVECPAGVPCPDTDSDGIPDQLDASEGDATGTGITGSGDSDGDGISDANECLTGVPCPDVDQDGMPDYMDSKPGDGPIADFDNDGLPNYLDPDDDNDRIPDVVEDPDFDADNNPFTNPLDSDLDGTPDYLDTDSDNDGLSDSAESGASGNDSDGDNIDDSYDVDMTGGTDANSDGVDDNVLPRDSDADNLPDYLDTVFDGGQADSDNDGIPDEVECPVFPTDCPDTDNDGTPDFLETDSDGDGLDDSDEAGSLSSGVLLDTDGDGTPDYRDLDSDGDGIDDATEGLSTDSDGDGIPDALDADSSGAPYGGDSDGDGVADMDECNTYPDCKDSNNDGTPDYMDANVSPYDANATINTGLNGVGGNGPMTLLFIITAFGLRRKIKRVVRKE